MIVHAVQFDRPLSNVWLGGDVVPAVPGSATAAGPNDAGHDGETHPSVANASKEFSEREKDSKAIQQLLGEIAGGVSRLETQTGHWKHEIQALSIGLATMIVTEMIGSSDTMRIERVEKLLSDSLDRAQVPVAAFVHPDDFLQLGEYLESLELDVRSDASLETGECRVEFPSYDLVSSLSHQMQQIEDGLREVLNNA